MTHRSARPLAATITLLALAACSGGGPQPSTSPPPGPTPTAPPTALSLADLKYVLVAELGRPDFCDPDFYPIAVRDEAELARERFPGIRADASTYDAIIRHLGLAPGAEPGADGILAIYREWKMLNALSLAPAPDGFAFDHIVIAPPGAAEEWHVAGTIDAAGAITLLLREPSGPPPCPICLARGTTIDTPDGPLPVESLRPGMTVWTVDEKGRRVAAAILEVGSNAVPETHRIVHLVLRDGRTLDVSPGHPLPDGRLAGDLRPGDLVDGARVVSADLLDYIGGATFDLLPDGPTGTYWANGIPLASTLTVEAPR